MSRFETDDYAKLIKGCDSLIKEGRIASVGPLIARLNMARVPREHRTQLAKICRRAGLIVQGLRLLQPVLRKEQPLIDPPSDGEICEYSVLLSRAGSVDEALELLRKVDPVMAPEALLYQGFCHVMKWDYVQARRFFEEYLKSSADDSSKLIARVNLAASYISTDGLASNGLLLEFIEETLALAQKANNWRLAGNCHELCGQVHLFGKDYVKARASLESALEIFRGGQSYDLFFIRKWQAIIEASEVSSVQPILDFRLEAERKRHWESMREADLFALKIQFDQKSFDHLVFGTPLDAYKRRIEQQVGRTPSESYLWGRSTMNWLDIESGERSGSWGLNPGKQTHRVLAALARDFYAPRSSGTLFAELYSGEYFDVNTSTLRIRQAIMRTRNWLNENEIPAEIENHDGHYLLALKGDFSIRIPRERGEVSTHDLAWTKLKRCFAETPQFTVQDVRAKLGLSRTGFHRLAEWALKNGKIEKTGVGKATVYKIAA